MPLDYMRSSRERYRSPRALIATSRSLAFREAGPFGRSGAGGKKNGVRFCDLKNRSADCVIGDRGWLSGA